MKHLYLAAIVVLLGLFTVRASAQTFVWARTAGGIQNDYPNGSRVDAAGNTYVVGSFNDTIRFGSTVLVPGKQYYDNLYVAKYSASGSLEWAVSGGGPTNLAIRAMTIDSSGNTYVTGQFSDTVRFAPLAPGICRGMHDVFVLKIDTHGVFVKLTTFGGVREEDVSSISVGGTGAFYLAGYFLDSMTIGTVVLRAQVGTHDTGATYNPDAYLAKFDASGALAWARGVGSPGNNDYGYGVCLDESRDAVFFSGKATPTSSPVVFGSGTPFTWSGNGGFVARYSASAGNVAWVQATDVLRQIIVNGGGDVCTTSDMYPKTNLKIFDGASGAMVRSAIVPGLVIAMTYDRLDNTLVLGGTYEGTTTFGPSTFTSLGETDGFLARYDNLLHPLFAVTLGGTGSDGLMGVGVDSRGGIYAAGDFWDTAMCGTLPRLVAAKALDIFVAKLSASNWITGNVFRDVNHNGVQDDGPGSGFAGVAVRVFSSNSSVLCVTDSTGHYGTPVGAGTFTILLPSPPLHYTIGSTILIATFGGPFGSIATGKDFAYAPETDKHDVRVTLTTTTKLREGRTCTYVIEYENMGTVTEDGTGILTYGAPLTFSSATPPPDATGAQTKTWNYTSLAPGERRQISAALTLPVGVVAGTTITCKADITGGGTEETPDDNRSVDVGTVVNSHDPNDKQVIPGGTLSTAQVAAAPTLRYIIRFQNTGTAEAIDIAVRDTLDPNLLNGTFQTLSTSHPCTVSASASGAIQWNFVDVNLADSASDEPHSHGFITYSVQPSTSMRLNDSIRNKAAIYFDYNPAVVTNTTVTKVAAPVIITRTDSLTTRNITFADRFVIGKEFSVRNTKRPASPIQSIDIALVPPPTRPATVGELTIDGVAKPWSLPLAHIEAHPPMDDSLVFSCGVPDSANWNGHVEITVRHLDLDSMVLVTPQWSAKLVDRRNDSLRVVPATFIDPSIVGRAFTVRNSKRPASNIVGVSVNLQPAPRFASVIQGVRVDAVPALSLAMITPSASARDSIQFDLGLVDSSNWTGTVHVIAHHADGDSNEVAYGPWTVNGTSAVNARSKSIGGFGLLGVEPTPTSADASVKYTIGARSRATLQIVNEAGIVVSTVADGMHESGSFTQRIHAQEFSAGRYWVRLRTVNGVFAAPFVVVR